MKEYIIETPLAEVFINNVSQGLHNEYTCRNLQLAVKKGELENVSILYNNKVVHFQPNGKIDGTLLKGFYTLSYDLVFKLLD